MRRFFLRLSRWLLSLVLFGVGLVFALRFAPPPFTAFMMNAWVHAKLEGRSAFHIEYSWVPWSRLSPHAAIAVVAAEDQRFPSHHGFDLAAIQDAMQAHDRGRRLRGASTITQQVSKNLFLWSGRSWWRKALEASATVLIELLWSKQRILEVYLNIVELGDGIYGFEAAARHFFGKPAAQLSSYEAALLAAALPRPRQLHAERPSAYMRSRAAEILRQARQLGGQEFLKRSGLDD